MNRRTFLIMGSGMLGGLPRLAAAFESVDLEAAMAALEKDSGGRLGVSILKTGAGQAFGHRAHERFPLCSTFKWLVAAHVLHHVDGERLSLNRRVSFSKASLMDWSPVTRRHADGQGMTIGDLCEAAITESDNTATQLLLDKLGGIAGWNGYVRSIGDPDTRLDRGEPSLNEALPGDIRDTTTPSAMAANLSRLLLGDGLSPASREQLTRWMAATKYSGARFRSGMPDGWRLADKTGSGNAGTGAAGDVGVYWSPTGQPIVVVAYLAEAKVESKQQDAAIADVGRWARSFALS
jgi:beta-lactamase class A